MFPAGLFAVLTLIAVGIGLVVAGTCLLFGAGWAVLVSGVCALGLAALVSRGLHG